jgi:hypothetical protein
MPEPVNRICAGATKCACAQKNEHLLRSSAGGVRLAGDVANAAAEFPARRFACSDTQDGADLRQGDAKGVEQSGEDVNDGHVAIPSRKRESQDDHLRAEQCSRSIH